jgi:hypothetical protein
VEKPRLDQAERMRASGNRHNAGIGRQGVSNRKESNLIPSVGYMTSRSFLGDLAAAQLLWRQTGGRIWYRLSVTQHGETDQQNPERKQEQTSFDIRTPNEEEDGDGVAADCQPTRRQSGVDSDG